MLRKLTSSTCRVAQTLVSTLGLAVSLAAWPSIVGASVLLQTFDDPTITGFDWFGFSVALDGDNVLIGAPSDATNGSPVGQAHLFNATTGALLQTFDDPTITGFDRFGNSVALDGDNVLIGAPSDATNGSPVGQAHLFDAITGNLLQTFDDPTITGGDGFGLSVALDGDNVLIGAPFDATNGPPNGSPVGQAYLFNAITGNLLQTFDDPTITGGDGFGFSVALDGDNVLIGAPLDATNGSPVGQAHLFDAITGNLLQTFDDPTITGNDGFGFSVALDGDNVLIGALSDATNGLGVGQAYLFNATTGALLQTFNDPTITGADQFGSSVALDGDNVLIGAPFDATNAPPNGPPVGQAYLFSAVQVVEIDVKPGSDPNCFNLNGNGVIPVAILGSDALNVSDVKTDDTLAFNGLAVRVRGKKGPLCSTEYSNADEYLDLVCHFEDDPYEWLEETEDEATLTGELANGTSIEGTDFICIVP